MHKLDCCGPFRPYQEDRTQELFQPQSSLQNVREYGSYNGAKGKQAIESIKKMHLRLSAFAKRASASKSKVAAAHASAVFQEASHAMQMLTSKEGELKTLENSATSIGRALTAASGKNPLAAKYSQAYCDGLQGIRGERECGRQ